MVTSKRFTIVDREHIQFDVEYNEEHILFHLPRMKMSKTSYLDFLNIVPELHDFVRTMGHESMWTAIDPKDIMTAKLLDRVGAEMVGHSNGLNVYEYTGEK